MLESIEIGDIDKLVEELENLNFTVNEKSANSETAYLWLEIGDGRYSIHVVITYDSRKVEVDIEKLKTPIENFEEAKDQEPLGVLSEVDPVIRDVLTEVFGGAKIIDQMATGANIAQATYIVPRFSKVEDVDSLIQAFENKGFTIKTVIKESESANIMLTSEDGKIFLTVNFYYERQKVTIMVQKIG